MNMQKENSLNVKIIKINGNSFMDIGSNIKQSNRFIDIFITLNNKKKYMHNVRFMLFLYYRPYRRMKLGIDSNQKNY